MDVQKRVILLRNLLARMEYNEAQNHWKLVGVITVEEFQVLQDVLEALTQASYAKGGK